MPQRDQDSSQPTWLWFFLALPIGVITVLFWQRRRIQTLIQHRETMVKRPRYVEPDSIPIDTRPSYDMADMEEAHQADHAFGISEVSLQARKDEVIQETPLAEPLQPDDFKLIEGIGPKIAALLHEHGILTFNQLAAASFEELDEILVSAKIRQIANPGTWAEQASLAASGDIEGLKLLQGNLKGRPRTE